MTQTYTWHGTDAELYELVDAIRANCECEPRTYSLAPRCAAHRLLLDQHVLDRLLFAHRIADRLREEEFSAIPVDTA